MPSRPVPASGSPRRSQTATVMGEPAARTGTPLTVRRTAASVRTTIRLRMATWPGWSLSCSLTTAPALRRGAVALSEAPDEIRGVAQAGVGGDQAEWQVGFAQ
jgi:hypothetical protein